MKLGRMFVLLILLSAFGLPACSQKSYHTAESGLQYRFIKGEGKGEKPQTSDIVIVKMDYYINDSLLFSSKQLEKPMEFGLMPPTFKGDFFEGISIMSKGDSASFLCQADSVFFRIFRVKRLPEFVKPNAVMRFEISLDSFMTQQAFNERKLAEAQALADAGHQALLEYVKEKSITQTPRESGLYYIETVKGTGKQPKEGEKVKVHYRGTLLNGTEFDASYNRNQPFEFVLGMGQVIKGWDEGIALMREGGKATLILPYELAYGERAAGQIPPFSPLVFEVEFIEIVK